MFQYVDCARVAFVHQVRTNGPRGGIAALETYLKTGVRPAHDTWGR